MKGLKKLVLAAAVVAPFAHAEMTSIDDSMMSEMTGQAGITLDIDLNMTIGEVRYVDQDGFDTATDNLGSDQGFLTFSNVVVGNQSEGGAAQIRGVTIDVDSVDGIVIGLGQIGGGLVDSGFAASVLAGSPAVTTVDEGQLATGHYWRGLDVTADFGINGVEAGSFEITNITNFVPNALVMEGLSKFGIFTNLTNDQGGTLTTAALAGNIGAAREAVLTAQGASSATATQAQYNAATSAAKLQNIDDLLAGNFIDAYVTISAGGSDDGDASGTAQGLTISASTGFVIEKMAYVDDGREMGIHNFTMFDIDGSGNIIGFQINGLTIDVVDHVAAVGTSTTALKIGGATMTGTIAMGDIYIGDHNTGSLGSVAIKDINMSGTDIYVYGH